MFLWVIFSALTAGVVAVLLWGTQRVDPGVADAAEADVAVYADQIEQLAADRARGLVSAVDAEAARAEIGRRMLARAAPVASSAPPVASTSDRIGRAAALSIPVLALSLYAWLGSPGLPDVPHSGRTPETAARSQVDAMIARVEQRLREAPEDGNGWDVIGPVYLRMERYGQAAEAFANANRLLGESPKRLAGFAEAEILANNGVVNPNAKTAAERLLVLEPGRVDARLWIALAKEQDGQFSAALAEYRALREAPQLSPDMKSAIDLRISIVDKLARGETVEPATGQAAVPTAPADQRAMIEGMVARLAARLASDGNDPAGWVQLLRSYMVMGRKDEAVKALADARRVLTGNAAALAEINTAATDLGVEAAAKDEKP
jgi:cytochrome c-type biogenesis protein CcmH